MEPIPDTGGGLSGFIAYLLWHVCLYLPFPRALILLLAFLIRVVHLPFLWKLVAYEMKVLSCGDDTWRAGYRRLIAYWTCWTLWSIAWLPLMVWFFLTPAGRTLVESHDFFLTGVTEKDFGSVILFFGGCFVLPLGIMRALAAVLSTAENRYRATVRREGPVPSRDRGLLAVFLGGGMYATKVLPDGSWKMDSLGPGGLFFEPIAYFPTFLLVCPLLGIVDRIPFGIFFAVLWPLLITRVLMEGFRMLFVHILHKQTFG